MPQQARPLYIGGNLNDGKIVGDNFFILDRLHPNPALREIARGVLTDIGGVSPRMLESYPRFIPLMVELRDDEDLRDLHWALYEGVAQGLRGVYPKLAALIMAHLRGLGYGVQKLAPSEQELYEERRDLATPEAVREPPPAPRVDDTDGGGVPQAAPEPAQGGGKPPHSKGEPPHSKKGSKYERFARALTCGASPAEAAKASGSRAKNLEAAAVKLLAHKETLAELTRMARERAKAGLVAGGNILGPGLTLGGDPHGDVPLPEIPDAQYFHDGPAELRNVRPGSGDGEVAGAEVERVAGPAKRPVRRVMRR